MKKFFRALASFVAIICVLIIGVGASISYNMPKEYKSLEDCNIELQTYVPLRVEKAYTNDYIDTTFSNVKTNNSYSAKLMLMGTIPIKNVNVETVEDCKIIPCGTPFGIKIFTQGVMIVGISGVQTESGELSPGNQAGLREGDIINKVNDEEIDSNEEFAAIIQSNVAKDLKLLVNRNNTIIETTLTPVKSCQDGTYKVGLWVRDSSAGIGSLTFYNPKTGDFAGLGHGICDIDTGELLPLMHGDIVKASISGIVKGEKGSPGELKGYFTDDKAIGQLLANTNTGLYGTLNLIPSSNEEISVAMKQQVKSGKAQVLTTISGETPEYYDVEISNVNYNENCPTKNMIVTITDERLLESTGGIVQGMSGSPIIQEGKLIGAVTHVFVNDSKKGYGIFAETMLTNSNELYSKREQKAS